MNLELHLKKLRDPYIYDLALIIVVWALIFTGVIVCMTSTHSTKDAVPVFTKVHKIETTIAETANLPEAPAPTPEPEPALPATEAEIDLLALVTMAEAEGESELGKRLVIDTILNRVDEPRFKGNTIHDIVYARNQFEAMWNGRVDRCYVREDIRQLVIEELQNRTNSEVVYFRTGRYSSDGIPLFKEGNHYFSKIK